MTAYTLNKRQESSHPFQTTIHNNPLTSKSTLHNHAPHRARVKHQETKNRL